MTSLAQPVAGRASSPKLAPVRAVERAAALLRCFQPDRPHLTLTELAASARLDKGTARRLLHTLIACDLVVHDADAQRYGLSIGILPLGNAVAATRGIRELSAPVLTELSRRTGSTSFLFVPHQGHALCVQRVRAEVTTFDAAWFEVNGIMPLNCGGAARVILAHLPEEQREQALALPLPKRTPFSQTEPDELRGECARIRAQGYELAIDDFHIGMCGLGVPVFDVTGRLAGAVSLSSLTSILAPGGAPQHLDDLRWAAAQIGRRVPAT